MSFPVGFLYVMVKTVVLIVQQPVIDLLPQGSCGTKFGGVLWQLYFRLMVYETILYTRNRHHFFSDRAHHKNGIRLPWLGLPLQTYRTLTYATYKLVKNDNTYFIETSFTWRPNCFYRFFEVMNTDNMSQNGFELSTIFLVLD